MTTADPHRNLHPHAEARLAMVLWSHEYAYEQKGGCMDFWDSLPADRKRLCINVIDGIVEAESWTPEHDDSHSDGELAAAAVCYAFTAVRSAHHIYNYVWPWSSDWWKPSEPRRNLVKAGALILAEIERLDRALLSRLSASDDAKEGGR